MRMWSFGTVEHRESATDAIVSALVSQASGSSRLRKNGFSHFDVVG